MKFTVGKIMCMGLAKISSNKANRYKGQQQHFPLLPQKLAWQPKQAEMYLRLDFDQHYSLLLTYSKTTDPAKCDSV